MSILNECIEYAKFQDLVYHKELVTRVTKASCTAMVGFLSIR